MEDLLYIVNRTEDANGMKWIVIATLTKINDSYCYTPYNLDVDCFPRADCILVCEQLPDMAQRRLYSSRRTDIKEILAKYGMSDYDEWELLKRTKGRLMSDNLLYLSKDELLKVSLNHPLISFIGCEEALVSHTDNN